MSVGKLIVIGIALVFVSGGMGAALADWNDAPQSPGATMELVDVDARKDDGSDEILEDADEDDDPGGGGAAGAQNSPVQGAAAGDGDATAGDDATAGGDNTEAALAPSLPPLVAGGAGGGVAAEPAPVAGAAAGGDSDSGGDSG